MAPSDNLRVPTRSARQPSEETIQSHIEVWGSSLEETEATGESSQQVYDTEYCRNLINEVHSNKDNAETPKTNAELRVATQLVSAIWTDIASRHAAGGVETPFSEDLNVAIYNIALASVQTWRPSLDKSQWKEFAKNPSFNVDVGWGENTLKNANGTVDLNLRFTAGDSAKYPQVREDGLWIGQTFEVYKDLFPDFRSISAATTKTRRGKRRHQGY